MVGAKLGLCETLLRKQYITHTAKANCIQRRRHFCVKAFQDSSPKRSAAFRKRKPRWPCIHKAHTDLWSVQAAAVDSIELEDEEEEEIEDRRPSSADTAQTIVDIMSHGTLASLNEDGTPLATYSSYILEAGGTPLLRLRADAVHRGNLDRNPKCSLFVQPQDFPARNLARVTLIGEAVPVDEETAEEARSLHKELANRSLGVDAPKESDQIYRLVVEKCFYVGGMGSGSEAEVIAAEEYRNAKPDALRLSAPQLVEFFNRDRADDVLRIASMASSSAIEQIYIAELLWVDSWGAYIAVERFGYEAEVHRVSFQRAVMDERDARSVLTLLAQFAWEDERHYSPPIPDGIA